MAYSVRIERIDTSGVPDGRAVLFEADSELEAVTIATYEVDAHRSAARRIATVFDPRGLLVLAYAGRARDGSDAVRG